MIMGRNCEKYGRYYWCVKTDQSPDGEIYLHADDVLVKDGCLNFVNSKGSTNMCFAPGNWKSFFAASVIDGGAIAVEYWKDEVPEPYKEKKND